MAPRKPPRMIRRNRGQRPDRVINSKEIERFPVFVMSS